VSGVTYEQSTEVKEIAVEGVFIEVGTVPGVVLAKNLGVSLDDKDYIIVDQTQVTNVEGVWAAGDATTGSNKFRQIITAVAEGAVASGSVYRKLKL
jgi:thioredoxin reductase